MTNPIDRADLKAAISAFLTTQSEFDPEEYWATPHEMALQVLTDFMEFTAPHTYLARIAELEAELAQLKAEVDDDSVS